MGFIYTYTERGAAGGTWYAASYPLGATRYYRTAEARETAVAAYCSAIRATGGAVVVVES